MTEQKNNAAGAEMSGMNRARQCIYGTLLELYPQMQRFAKEIGELSYNCSLSDFLAEQGLVCKDTVKNWKEEYDKLLTGTRAKSDSKIISPKNGSYEAIAEKFNEMLKRYCEINHFSNRIAEAYYIDPQMLADGIPLFNLKKIIEGFGLEYYDVYTAVGMEKQKFEKLMKKQVFLNKKDIEKFENFFWLEKGSLWQIPPSSPESVSCTSYFVAPPKDEKGNPRFGKGECLRRKRIRENYQAITGLLSKKSEKMFFTLIYDGEAIHIISHQTKEQELHQLADYSLTLEEAEEITKNPCDELGIHELTEIEREVIYKLATQKPCTLIRNGKNFYVVNRDGQIIDFKEKE